MVRVERKQDGPASLKGSMWSTGAEQPVVARKAAKAVGAKGLRYPVGANGQPVLGGAVCNDKAI